MTGPHRPPAAGSHGDGTWLAITDGVLFSVAWLQRHTPALLARWRRAGEDARRLIAAAILHTAAEMESDRIPPEQSWADLGRRIDPRLLEERDWPYLAAAIAQAAATGFDVSTRLPELAAEAGGLPDRHPARELHFRVLFAHPAALAEDPIPPVTAPRE